MVDHEHEKAKREHVAVADRALASRRAAMGQHIGGNILPLDQLLSLPEVRQLTSKSRASIYRGMKDGTFPAALKIGKARIAWRSSDINNWMRRLPKSMAAAA